MSQIWAANLGKRSKFVPKRPANWTHPSSVFKSQSTKSQVPLQKSQKHRQKIAEKSHLLVPEVFAYRLSEFIAEIIRNMLFLCICICYEIKVISIGVWKEYPEVGPQKCRKSAPRLLGPCPGCSFRTLVRLFWGSGPGGPGRPCVGRGRSQAYCLARPSPESPHF